MLAAYSAENSRIVRRAEKKMAMWINPFAEWQHMGKPEFDSLKIDNENSVLTIFFSPELSYFPFREDSYNRLINSIEEQLGKKFRKFNIKVYTSGYLVNQLVPAWSRDKMPADPSRFRNTGKSPGQVVKRPLEYNLSEGLQDNTIALWHSHGYYYEMSLDRWEFQRAKLFGTVEDMSVMGIVVPFLIPMLENAGANVFLPRERDIQTNEIIVDNDFSDGNSKVVIQLDNSTRINKGFLKCDTLFSGDNPFLNGTSLRISGSKTVFVPEFAESGNYAVYAAYQSFPDNSDSVSYIVSHTGGETQYYVNQTMGGGTWIYLGTFRFNSGLDELTGSVTVSAPGNEKYVIDALKFGGGYGNVARRPAGVIQGNQQSAVTTSPSETLISKDTEAGFRWKTSGMPRYLEGARYYLQYAGMPDSMVYSPTFGKNDYNDDYQSRGLWVNYLMADPYDNISGKQPGGKGIPVDMAFGFHTDAGVAPADSIIGTLAIYSTASANGLFPDSSSRLISRDLSDLIQSQVVDDIRLDFNSDWTRRGLWDKPYAEARRPDVPAVLIELLSHQNLADMTLGLDPRFRFAVSRSIYKGILKFLSFTGQRDYTVQPLPVNSFAIEHTGGKKIRLSWEPAIDKSEPSAIPEGYLLYMRTGDNGFGNGIPVNGTNVDFELAGYDTVYSFKIRAYNKGGESFDSEVLSVGIRENDDSPVLIVNGFDRICGPEWFDTGELAGVTPWSDKGVPYLNNFITIGDQYDFERSSPWIDDDAPGWGATYSDRTGSVSAGNSFDFPYIHGKAVMASGHSFVSVSDEYFESEKLDPEKYKIVDLIFGEERSTKSLYSQIPEEFNIYTPGFIKKVMQMTDKGSNIFMSGAYPGSDLDTKGDSADIRFASEILHFSHRTGKAVRTGKVWSTDISRPYFDITFDFNTRPDSRIYQVEAPDAIEPSGNGARTAFRYSESNSSAGITFSGKYRTVVLGFPFETISSEKARNELMKGIMLFLNEK